jgi:hypothetical protein
MSLLSSRSAQLLASPVSSVQSSAMTATDQFYQGGPKLLNYESFCETFQAYEARTLLTKRPGKYIIDEKETVCSKA